MTEIVSPQSVAFVETLAGLDGESLGLLRDMMLRASALGPDSTLFLRECQIALDSDSASPSDLLAPVFDRWAVAS